MELIDIIAWGIEVECHGDYYMVSSETGAFLHTPVYSEASRLCLAM